MVTTQPERTDLTREDRLFLSQLQRGLRAEMAGYYDGKFGRCTTPLMGAYIALQGKKILQYDKQRPWTCKSTPHSVPYQAPQYMELEALQSWGIALKHTIWLDNLCDEGVYFGQFIPEQILIMSRAGEVLQRHDGQWFSDFLPIADLPLHEAMAKALDIQRINERREGNYNTANRLLIEAQRLREAVSMSRLHWQLHEQKQIHAVTRWMQTAR